MLRKGNAGSNTAADHIAVLKAAFAQLPGHRPGRRPGRSVLVRADGAGGTHELLSWLTAQRVQYSVGFSLPDSFTTELAMLDRAELWQPAYDGDGQIRDGAFVAEATGLLNLASWPSGMRVILRKERPHPGAQLRITDHDGNRVTAFATNKPRGQLADLELRQRRRARCEDRIRISKDTGLTNLPLHDFDQNRIWLAIVALGRRTHRLAGRCSPSPTSRHADGNPNACACGCSRSRPDGGPRPDPPRAPPRSRTLGPAPRPRHRPPPAHPNTHLTWHDRTDYQKQPDRGTGAPSDLGRTVTPPRHNRKPQRPPPQVSRSADAPRKIRDSGPDPETLRPRPPAPSG